MRPFRPSALTASTALGGAIAITIVPAGADAALYTYSRLDQIGRWVIERKLSQNGPIQCRAFIPSGGTWFESNVRLNKQGEVVVPVERSYSADPQELAQVKDALRRCEADMIYVP